MAESPIPKRFMRILLLTMICTIVFKSTVLCQKISYFDISDTEYTTANGADYSVEIKKMPNGTWQRTSTYIREKRLRCVEYFSDDSLKQYTGLYTYYHHNGLVQETGTYVNNKKEGEWISYFLNGKKSAVLEYRNDTTIGNTTRWYQTGEISNKAEMNKQGNGKSTWWFKNGMKMEEGLLQKSDRDGKWIFYDNNGQICAETYYKLGKEVGPRLYANDDGKLVPTNDTSNGMAAEFIHPSGQTYQTYILENTYQPDKPTLGSGEILKLQVVFCVNELGEVTNAHITNPYKKEYNNEVLTVINSTSKMWKPATRMNKRVAFWQQQTFTFVGEPIRK